MKTILEAYRQFKSTAELNAAANTHRYRIAFQTNQTEIAVLDAVAKYSVKYGAAWLKVGTLAKLIGKSIGTVRRALAKLEQLEVLERIPFMRKISGGNGGNIIRILPTMLAGSRQGEREDDCPQMTARLNVSDSTASNAEATELKTESINLYKPLKTLSTIAETYQAIVSEATPTLYQKFAAVISDKKQRREFYAVARSHMMPLKRFNVYDDDLIEHIAYDALLTALRASEHRTIRNTVGYYAGILDNKLDALYEAEIRRLAIY